MKENPWLVTGETYRTAQSNHVEFNVRVNLDTFSEMKQELLMRAMVDAVHDWVKENLAKEMVVNLVPRVNEELEAQIVERVVTTLFNDAMKRIDLDTVVKIATVHAGKQLAKDAT